MSKIIYLDASVLLEPIIGKHNETKTVDCNALYKMAKPS
jgi:hypothetical protein